MIFLVVSKFKKQPPEVFLEISHNSQESTVSETLFNKVAGLGTGVFL